MDTNNPTQPVQAQPIVDANPVQQPVQDVQQPVQQTIVATPKAQYSMPVARAGQLLAIPAPVTGILTRASSRTTEQGELIILEFEGFPTAVVRTMAQAKGDLIENYNREQLNAMNTTLASASYNRYFKGRAVKMVASYHEVGAIHTVTAESALYKSGQAQLGQQIPTTSEGIWIEGFLNVEQTAAELDTIIARELEAIASLAKANAGLLL